MDCSPPGSSLHGILQARIRERVAMPSSRGSQPRDWISIPCIAANSLPLSYQGSPKLTYDPVIPLLGIYPEKIISQKDTCTQMSISSVQFSCSVVSDSLWSHESHQARPTCPSPTPGVHSNSCPLMPSNHLILFCPFSSCSQSFPAWGSFPMSQLFAPGSQSIGASASVLLVYSGQISFRIDCFDLRAVQSTLKSLLQHHSLKASILWCLAFFMVWHSHLYMTMGKISFDQPELCQQSNVSAF